MQEQSAKLADVVSVFKLDGLSGTPALARPAATARTTLPRRTPAVAAAEACCWPRRPLPGAGSGRAAPAVAANESGDWEEF
jgi:methyl-accepting chemotaxis protein